jgi:hypothetical protein
MEQAKALAHDGHCGRRFVAYAWCIPEKSSANARRAMWPAAPSCMMSCFQTCPDAGNAALGNRRSFSSSPPELQSVKDRIEDVEPMRDVRVSLRHVVPRMRRARVLLRHVQPAIQGERHQLRDQPPLRGRLNRLLTPPDRRLRRWIDGDLIIGVRLIIRNHGNRGSAGSRSLGRVGTPEMRPLR